MLAFENAVYYTTKGFRRGGITVEGGRVFLSPSEPVKEADVSGKSFFPVWQTYTCICGNRDFL